MLQKNVQKRKNAESYRGEEWHFFLHKILFLTQK